MNDKEAVRMMRRCAIEIRDLRAQIAYLQPKADAYDNMAVVLRLLPRPPVRMAEDLAWLLDKTVREMEAADQQDETEAAVDG